MYIYQSSSLLWQELSQLQGFGQTANIFYFLIIIAGIIASYICIRPFVSLLIAYKSIRLISYIVSSLLCIVVLFFMATIISNEQQLIINDLLKFMLLGLAIFGVVLIVLHLIQQLIKFVRTS